MPQFLLEYAWLFNRFAANVLVEIDGHGKFARVVVDSPDVHGAERVAGISVPGFINIHSHAFQRGMAGLSEYRSANRDDFWTWRELMYHFLRWLEPDDCFVLARQLYLEMLQAGYTAVGEFHYLHNDPSGRPYAHKSEMIAPLLAAAEEVGLRICLMPTLYQRGGFGQALNKGQRRFSITVDDCLELARGVLQRSEASPLVHAGFAIHSLRAVDMPVALQAVRNLRRDLGDLPVHIHASEQRREVEDCWQHHRRRPVDWILDELQADQRWCLIHSTHIEAQECARLAESQAIAGLCPTTEANLGDGIFPATDYFASAGRFAIGSDSHIAIDPRGELRLLEYVQRLTQQRRVLFGSANESSGVFLCESAWRGGAAALGLAAGGIDAGSLADLVVLDVDDAALAGLPPERWLDALVFCQIGNPIRHVMVHGRWVIRDGRHSLDQASRREFAATVRSILERE